MNSQQRNRYRERHYRQITRFERKYLPLVIQALKNQVDKAVQLIQERGPNSAAGAIDLVIINEDIFPVLRDLWLDISIFFANQTYGEIERSARQRTRTKAQANFGFNAKWSQEVINYLNQFLLDRAVLPITQTTKQQILQILQQWAASGLGVDEMVAMIQDPSMIAWRARMIVRTEALYASAYGKQMAQAESPYECSKEWIAAHDHRTRHGHREADGQIVDESARFAVNVYTKEGDQLLRTEYLLYPGDRSEGVSAENLINCRCSHAVFAKRDRQGNLIMKK